MTAPPADDLTPEMRAFSVALQGLIFAEMTPTDPARLAHALERMLSAAAGVVVILAGGDAAMMNTLLEGSSQYLFTEATSRAPVVRHFAARSPGMQTYIFFRAEGFYPVNLPGDNAVPENVRLNPGTLRVEDLAGRVVWPAPRAGGRA